jgi:hypothetical protein
MRIVTRDQFLELPAGTIYSVCDAVAFDGLFRKEQSIRDTVDGRPFEFMYRDLTPSCRALSERPRFNAEILRNGEFGEFRRNFAIWEPEDIEQLKKLL